MMTCNCVHLSFTIKSGTLKNTNCNYSTFITQSSFAIGRSSSQPVMCWRVSTQFHLTNHLLRAPSFCPLAFCVSTSRSPINDPISYSKTNNASFPWYSSQNKPSPARSTAPRPNQVQMSLNCFLVFSSPLPYPSFLSGIPHSERTAI